MSNTEEIVIPDVGNNRVPDWVTESKNHRIDTFCNEIENIYIEFINDLKQDLKK